MTIPSRVVVGRLQQARMVPDDKASKFKQGPTGGRGLLDVRSTKFGGVGNFNRGTAAISQGSSG